MLNPALTKSRSMTGRSQAGLEAAQKQLGNDAIVVSSEARSLTDIDALAAQVKTEFDTVPCVISLRRQGVLIFMNCLVL